MRLPHRLTPAHGATACLLLFILLPAIIWLGLKQRSDALYAQYERYGEAYYEPDNMRPLAGGIPDVALRHLLSETGVAAAPNNVTFHSLDAEAVNLLAGSNDLTFLNFYFVDFADLSPPQATRMMSGLTSLELLMVNRCHNVSPMIARRLIAGGNPYRLYWQDTDMSTTTVQYALTRPGLRYLRIANSHITLPAPAEPAIPPSNHLSTLRLYNCTWEPGALQHLAGSLGTLQDLSISGEHLDDDMLTALQPLTACTKLYLGDTSLTFSAFHTLQYPGLQKLYIYNIPISSEAAAALLDFATRHPTCAITLRSTGIDEADAEPLRKLLGSRLEVSDNRW